MEISTHSADATALYVLGQHPKISCPAIDDIIDYHRRSISNEDMYKFITKYLSECRVCSEELAVLREFDRRRAH